MREDSDGPRTDATDPAATVPVAAAGVAPDRLDALKGKALMEIRDDDDDPIRLAAIAVALFVGTALFLIGFLLVL